MKFIGTSILVFGAIVLAVATGSNKDENSKNSSSTEDEPKANSASVISSKNEPAAKVGDKVTTSKFEITVSSVKARSKVGSQFLESTPAEGAVYVCIEWDYKNISGRPIGSFSLPSLHLKDPNGNKYDSDAGASGSYSTELNLNQKILSDVNPGIKIRDAEVFEVSKELLQKGNWRIFIEADKEINMALE